MTQIRVSDDYGPSTRPDQWALGDTALLAHALGLSPFKDVFWSSVAEPGSIYNDSSRETKPNLEAAISSLSAGPVGPGDKIGLMDRGLIMRACDEDGRLLKPSRPITSIDATFRRRAYGRDGPQGALMTTYSTIGDLRFDIILAAALNATYRLQPADLAPAAVQGASNEQRPVMVAWNHSFVDGSGDPEVHVLPFGGKDTLPLPPCGRSDFQLWYTSPVLAGGLVVLGEMAKWVPVSPQRILSIESVEQSGETRIRVQGAVGEGVVLGFAVASNLKAPPLYVHCTIAASGEAVATVRVEPSGTAPTGVCL